MRARALLTIALAGAMVVATDPLASPAVDGDARPAAVVALAQPPRPTPPRREPAPYRLTAYTIATLAPDALPHVGTGSPAKTLAGLQDADGIPMKQVGSKRYYSPAGLAQYGIRYEDAFRRLGDPEYLAIARKVEQKLMSLGVLSNSGVYLPYRYDYALHGIARETMRAPWYSAMAQGIALSLAVRLYRDTGDAAYLADARRLFNTFRHIGRGKNPWVTYIDAGRYLWLEEYPEPLTPSDHTANGFDFALFGVYDFYEETHDPVSLQVLRAGLTTMRDHIAVYRIAGSPSRYCLRHGPSQLKYHRIVTGQLLILYRISGDTSFLKGARVFARDAT